MSIAAATIAKPAFFDSIINAKDPIPLPGAAHGSGHAATLDDPDLCPKWPPLPHPHHSLADLVANLTGLNGSSLGAQLVKGDGYCGNGSGPRPPLPHGV